MKNCDNKQPDIKINFYVKEAKKKCCFANDFISQVYKNALP